MNHLAQLPHTLTGVPLTPNSPADLAKKAEIFGMLEKIGEALDLTDTQYQKAKTSYEAVGDWLAGSANPLLSGVLIYPQGSVALGTANKPIGADEHDVDLVAHLSQLLSSSSPAALKLAIGERLREHAVYAAMLEEKQRCWRLTYAGDFHMDITPSVPNPNCEQGGELVPDKKLSRWKPSNPRGYKKLFDKRAALKPAIRVAKALTEDARIQAEVVSFPAQTSRKGVLRRTVQLLKRHRDVYFRRRTGRVAPLSVIITTLAAQSYEMCVKSFEFDNGYDLLRATISFMPMFIESEVRHGHRQWYIWNETTQGENFAEKWNAEPDRAAAFFDWHKQALADVDRLLAVEGLDQMRKSLVEAVGDRPVSKAFGQITATVDRARSAGTLRYSPAAGLGAATAVGTSVRANTFFGA